MICKMQNESIIGSYQMVRTLCESQYSSDLLFYNKVHIMQTFANLKQTLT